MAKRPTSTELRELVTKARDNYIKLSRDLAHNDNPQVVSMRDQFDAKAAAYDYVLEAMAGNTALLRIESGL